MNPTQGRKNKTAGCSQKKEGTARVLSEYLYLLLGRYFNRGGSYSI